jgi:hypothetical protein
MIVRQVLDQVTVASLASASPSGRNDDDKIADRGGISDPLITSLLPSFFFLLKRNYFILASLAGTISAPAS